MVSQIRCVQFLLRLAVSSLCYAALDFLALLRVFDMRRVFLGLNSCSALSGVEECWSWWLWCFEIFHIGRVHRVSWTKLCSTGWISRSLYCEEYDQNVCLLTFPFFYQSGNQARRNKIVGQPCKRNLTHKPCLPSHAQLTLNTKQSRIHVNLGSFVCFPPILLASKIRSKFCCCAAAIFPLTMALRKGMTNPTSSGGILSLLMSNPAIYLGIFSDLYPCLDSDDTTMPAATGVGMLCGGGWTQSANRLLRYSRH